MKRIAIHTKKYIAELDDFTHSVRNICTVNNRNKYIWESSATNIFIEALMLLLHTIALLENPVYRHSPKLRDLAEGLLNTNTYEHEKTILTAFVKTNKELCLEGYVTFRMEAYHEKLDMMLYTIVKKINSNKH